MNDSLNALCPACGAIRNLNTQQVLLQTEARYYAAHRHDTFATPTVDVMRQLAAKGRENWFWACDECIESGKAISADYTKHNIGMGVSFAAYVDRHFNCVDCSCDFAFSAQEQQHWFEQLNFLLWVYPKRCVTCRKKRRRSIALNNTLAELLKNLDPADPEQLREVARVYSEMNIDDKAGEFNARAKNIENKR